MSTLDKVREMIFQPAEVPPADVLKAAQEELARLSHLVGHAKNVVQRNGARKKLAELEPLLPALQIEVGLTGLEKLLAEGKSGGQRAAARVQCQKLASQIAALPAGEEQDLFRQWLAELHPSTDSTRPSFEVATLAPNAPEEKPAAPPLPDLAQELQTALQPLLREAQLPPIADPGRLARESEALAQRINELPPGEARTSFEQGISSITTALKAAQELHDLVKATAALEENAARPDADLSALIALHRQLAVRAAAPTGPEGAVVKEKLTALEASMALRQESREIETALQRSAAEIQKNATNEANEASLTLLAERIARLKDEKDRHLFSQRVETLRKTLSQRREEARVSAALDEIQQQKNRPNPSLPALQSAVDEVAGRVQALPIGEVRSGFEKRVQEGRASLALLREKPVARPPQPAVVLRLEPVNGKSVPAGRPLIFVARDRFSIGRKPENEPPRADLLTPSSELRISRIHITLLARQRQIHVLAGEENKPSTNPAMVDETQLSATPVVIGFDRERRIDLTGVLRLRAKLIQSSSPFGPPFGEENGIQDSTTVLVPPIDGALRFRAEGEDRLPLTAVWLFTDATIGSNPNCAATLPLPGIAPEEVRVHFWRKSFWIEVLRRDSFVQLAGKPLSPGAAQPLFSDQELRLGTTLYKVQLQ